MKKPPQWFKDWLGNDFHHLKMDVRENKWLLRILVGGLILINVIDKLS